MRFLSSLETKAIEGDKTGPPRWLGTSQRTNTPGQTPWLGWNTARAVTDAYDREPYVFRGIHAFAVAISRLPVVLRESDPWYGKIVDTDQDPLLNTLNRRANGIEFGAGFRYRLATQLMLSKRGVFVERVKSRAGDLLGLHLLPPDSTFPIMPTMEELSKDPDMLVSSYTVRLPGLPPMPLPPEDVCWIRWPHPTDPYSGVTPLESLGLSIDTSFYGRLYNRRFLAKDGRPGGVLALKGRLSPEETSELQRRFRGIDTIGETTVLSVDDVSYVDTASNPRDMAYNTLRGAMKEEVLTGIGTPESIAGNASGRTFDNADAEKENWYVNEIMPNAELIGQALSISTEGGEDDNLVVGYDISKIAVLQRFERERNAYHLEELAAQAITVTEYRLATGREALSDAEKDDLSTAGQPAAPPASAPLAVEAPKLPPLRVANTAPSGSSAVKSATEPPPFGEGAHDTARLVRGVLTKRRHLRNR